MDYTITRSNIAVANEFYLQPMKDCPVNVEVQLLTLGGVLVRGRWDGKSTAYEAWCPFPRKLEE